jgi:hypothetical protein
MVETVQGVSYAEGGCERSSGPEEMLVMRSFRRFLLFVAVGAAAVAPFSAVAAAFEGTLKWRTLQVDASALAKIAGDPLDADAAFAVPLDILSKMHGEAVVTEVTVHVKGSHMRSESTAGGGRTYSLVDLESGETIVVTPAEKKALVVTEEDVRTLESRAKSMRGIVRQKIADAPPEKRGKLEAALGWLADDPPAAGSAALEPLGRTETVNGMDAKAYRLRAGSQTSEGWVTQARPDVQEGLRQIERRKQQVIRRADGGMQAKEVLGREGLVVRVKTLGRDRYTWEDLIEVDTKPLDDALFEVPPDFTKVTNEVMVRRLGAAAEGSPPEAPQ